MMQVWLDDERPAPEGWQWCKTVSHAQAIFRSVPVDRASLDHDLGMVEEDGYDLLNWIVETDHWPLRSLAVHTANSVRKPVMCAVVERYGPYDMKEHITYDGTVYDAVLYSKSEA